MCYNILVIASSHNTFFISAAIVRRFPYKELLWNHLHLAKTANTDTLTAILLVRTTYPSARLSNPITTSLNLNSTNSLNSVTLNGISSTNTTTALNLSHLSGFSHPFLYSLPFLCIFMHYYVYLYSILSYFPVFSLSHAKVYAVFYAFSPVFQYEKKFFRFFIVWSLFAPAKAYPLFKMGNCLWEVIYSPLRLLPCVLTPGCILPGYVSYVLQDRSKPLFLHVYTALKKTTVLYYML